MIATVSKFEYPKWKVIAWRFGRTFIAAFLASGSYVLIAVTPDAFNSLDKFLKALLFPFLIAGATAGINAIGKLLRDEFGNKEQTSTVDKIPV